MGRYPIRIAGPLLVAAVVALAASVTRAGVLLGLGVGAAALFLSAGWLNARSLARMRLDRRPFPDAWRRVLEQRVGFYRRLSDADKPRFERDVRYFVAEHTITGPRGAPVDDELAVLVGASAAILSFGRPGYRYERVRDIVVYDEAFDDDYQVSRGGHILGQVAKQGPIVFSARALREGFTDAADGHNVGLHEMAHVLDFDGDGAADGVPSLVPWREMVPWLAVVHDEVRRVRRHRSVLRSYAGTNEAELFAVATEAFFERPRELARKHPELYAMLRDAYGQDPAARDRDGRDVPDQDDRRRERNERKRRNRARRA